MVRWSGVQCNQAAPIRIEGDQAIDRSTAASNSIVVEVGDKSCATKSCQWRQCVAKFSRVSAIASPCCRAPTRHVRGIRMVAGGSRWCRSVSREVWPVHRILKPSIRVALRLALMRGLGLAYVRLLSYCSLQPDGGAQGWSPKLSLQELLQRELWSVALLVRPPIGFPPI